MRNLIHPQVVIKGVGVDHDKRQACAGNFVVDFDAVGGAIRHDQSLIPLALTTRIVIGPAADILHLLSVAVLGCQGTTSLDRVDSQLANDRFPLITRKTASDDLSHARINSRNVKYFPGFTDEDSFLADVFDSGWMVA
jgi:hypothetical protein